MSERQLCQKNDYSTPHPRQDTAPPSAESGEAGRIRHDKETAHREMDLIARNLENGSKPGLKKKNEIWAAETTPSTLSYLKVVFVFFSSVSIISLGTRTVRTNANEVDRGRPSGNSGRGFGAIRAMCRAWRALKALSAGGDKTISRVFSVRHFFYALFFSNVGVVAPTYLVENDAACHNSGFPAQGQFWGTLSSKLGRAMCRVRCHVCMCLVYNALLFSQKNKGCRSKMLGCTKNFEFEDACSSPGKHSFMRFLVRL